MRRTGRSRERANTLRTALGALGSVGAGAKIREVRELGREVELVRAVVGMVPPGADAPNPAVNTVQSLVMAGHGDDMRVALVHNTPAAFHGRPELVEQLTRELTDDLRTGRVVTAG